MRSMKKAVTGALLALALTGFAFAQGKSVSVSGLNVEVPANWYEAKVPSDEPNTRVVLASNDAPAKQALMMISVEKRNGRTLESITSATRNYIATKMDGVLEFERATTIGGSPAHTFVYEGRSEHSNLGRRKFMRTIISRGDSFYILHGVADHVPFSQHAGALEQMTNTANWKS